MSNLSLLRLHRLIPSPANPLHAVARRGGVGRWFGGLMTAGLVLAAVGSLALAAWSGPASTTGAVRPDAAATADALSNADAAPSLDERLVALGYLPPDTTTLIVRPTPADSAPATARSLNPLADARPLIDHLLQAADLLKTSSPSAPTVSTSPPTPPVEPVAPLAPVAVTLASLPTVTAAPVPTAEPTEPHVVYLVDASGSMLDSLPDAVAYLQQEVASLREPAKFQVIFFQAAEVVDAPPREMKRATRTARDTLSRWLKTQAADIRPSGGSDVEQAMHLAMAYGATRVVILSDDKFNRRSAWGAGDRLIPGLRRAVNGRSVTINTVEFYYRGRSGGLEAVADAFGGTYHFVRTSRHTAAASPLDLP